MGTNYHTAWTTATAFKPADLNPALASLDKSITYLRNLIIHSDGAITYTAGTGVLDWAGTLRIIFNTEAGDAVENTVATANITLADNEFAYVDLNETDGTVLTMQKAAVTTASASNFVTFNRVVMGYRNTTSNEYFGSNLHLVGAAAGSGSATKYISFTVASDGTWDNEAVPIFQTAVAITISQVDAAVLGSTTPILTYNIEERASASLNSAGTDIYASDQTADGDGEVETSFSNAAIAAGAHLVLTTGSTAESGTVDYITGFITYTED
jgi:hypothetical protein